MPEAVRHPAPVAVTAPVEVIWRHWVDAVAIPLMTRLVVEATEDVMLVVEAKDAESVVPENEKNGLEVMSPSVVANGTRPERSEETMRLEVDAVPDTERYEEDAYVVKSW